MGKYGYGLLLLALLQGYCANQPYPDIKKGKTMLRLADGSPISTAEYDEYNPIIVQRNDGYLYLIFGSNRPCTTGCTTHNLFIARSVSAYTPAEGLPAFEAPREATFNATALDIANTRINFTAKGGANIRIYFTNMSGSIVYEDLPATPDVSNGYYTSNGGTSISNTTQNMGKVIGGSHDSGIFIEYSMSVIAMVPDTTPTAGTPLNNPDLLHAHSMAHMRPEITGDPETALIVNEDGVLLAGSSEFTFGVISSLNNSLLNEGLALSKLNIFYSNEPEADLVTFSAGDTLSGPQDMYVITSHNPGDLWFSMSPPEFPF